MSKSLMDAIRQTITEGAKEKTLDGMTPDAKRFRTDLHKVQDSGVKHMVQKASETKDYEKMFSGDVDKAPARLGDMPASKDLDKYVEYNEAVQMAEAKKAAKDERGCSEECECKDCESDKEEVNELYAAPGTPAGDAYKEAQKKNVGKPALPLQAGQKMPLMRDGPDAAGRGGVRKTINPYKAPAPQTAGTSGPKTRSFGDQPDSPNARIKSAIGGYLGQTAIGRALGMGADDKPKPPKPPASEAGATGFATTKSVTNVGRDRMYSGDKTQLAKAQGQPYGMKGPEAKAPVPKVKPAKPVAQAPAATAPKASQVKAKPVKPGAQTPAKPAPAAPQKKLPGMGTKDQVAGPRKDSSGLNVSSATRPSKPAAQSARPAKKTLPGMGTKNQVLGQSFEIDIAGTSYLVSEAHASAIAAFVEKYGAVNEAGVGEFISKEMKHPEKLTAKGKKQKIKQAIAIFYSKKRRGENP